MKTIMKQKRRTIMAKNSNYWVILDIHNQLKDPHYYADKAMAIFCSKEYANSKVVDIDQLASLNSNLYVKLTTQLLNQ